MLFDPELTFSFVSVYFSLGFDSISEIFSMPIHISTPVGDYLVVNQMYQSYIMTFSGRKTWVDFLV